MHRPDTIKGVLEFCAAEGQPTSTLEKCLDNMVRQYKIHGEISDIIKKELEYNEP